MPSGRTNNFPWKWAWPTSRDPTIFGIRSNISSKLLELETSNLLHGFVWAMPSTRTNNFHESGRGLGHVTATIFGSTVGYPSDSLASRFYWFVCVSVRVFVCVFLFLSLPFYMFAMGLVPEINLMMIGNGLWWWLMTSREPNTPRASQYRENSCMLFSNNR